MICYGLRGLDFPSPAERECDHLAIWMIRSDTFFQFMLKLKKNNVGTAVTTYTSDPGLTSTFSFTTNGAASQGSMQQADTACR
jgi:hypothetical protein